MKNERTVRSGDQSIAWARIHMGVLEEIRRRFTRERPFSNVFIGIALHVTKETANLVRTLKDGGAEIAIAGCNPLSTQDDVAEALTAEGIPVFARRGQTRDEYYQNLEHVISKMSSTERPLLATVDDGLDLVTRIHSMHGSLLPRIRVGTEETTTGVFRARAMAKDGALLYPVIAVNDNRTKHLFDNYYGTGQSTIDGVLRASGILLAGKKCIVAGYGDCGKGIALRARGMSARVFLIEIDPVRALQAHMDGFELTTMREAIRFGDIFVTATGNKHVISLEHMRYMRSGAILANAGHFDIEIDMEGLREAADKFFEVRPNFQKFLLNGKDIYVCGEGRLVNLVCAEGHPSEVMDLSFSGQALALEYGVKEKLSPGLHRLPESLDAEIAALKLKSLNLQHERLTDEQRKYLASWSEGT